MAARNHKDTKGNTRFNDLENSASSRMFIGALVGAVKSSRKSTSSSTRQHSKDLESWDENRYTNNDSSGVRVKNGVSWKRSSATNEEKLSTAVHSDVPRLRYSTKTENSSIDKMAFKSYSSSQFCNAELPQQLHDNGLDKYKLPIAQDEFLQNENLTNAKGKFNKSNSIYDCGKSDRDNRFLLCSVDNELNSDLLNDSLSSENSLHDNSKCSFDETETINISTSYSKDNTKLRRLSSVISARKKISPPLTSYQSDHIKKIYFESPEIKPPVPRQYQTPDSDRKSDFNSSDSSLLKRKMSNSIWDITEGNTGRKRISPPCSPLKSDHIKNIYFESPGIKPPVPRQHQTPDSDRKSDFNSSSSSLLKRKFSNSMSDITEGNTGEEFYTPSPIHARDRSKTQWGQYREVNPILAHLNSTPIEEKNLVRNQKLRRSYDSSTPKTHYSNSSHSHFRSHSWSKSTADQTPSSFTSTAPSYKRLRTDSYLPHYDSSEFQSLELADIGFIDSHCHLDFLFTRAQHRGSYAEYRDARKDQFPPCYQGCVAIFCDPSTFSKKSIWGPILEEENVWAAFGCHPHNSKDYTEVEDEALITALSHEHVVALGEIGLDYSNRNTCPKPTQKKVFRRQLQLAINKNLPLVIHCREAMEDCFEIMKEMVPSNHLIHLHCFTDIWENAKKWLDAFPRLFIGLTNVVTFPSAKSVHEVARNIPLERLLLETDTPYFLPRMMPRNLRWSHPGMAIHVAAQVAALKVNVTLEETLKAVRKNTRTMYGI